MAVDIFKLQGTVDVETGKAERGLKNIEQDAKRTQTELNRMGATGRQSGAVLANSVNSSIGAFGKLKTAIGGATSAAAGLRSVTGSLGNAFAGLGTELVSTALGKLTSGFNLAIKTGIDFQKMMEGAGIVFENLAGSVEGANKHLSDLKNFAKTSPFDLPDLIQASARMQAFGFSIQETVPLLGKLQNAAALAAGTSGNFTEALGGIVNALGQMRAKGAVSAEEMQQLAERGIPAWDLLAKKIGLTVEQTRKLSEQGKLRGGPATDALLEAFGEGKFAGLGEKLAKTTLGKESNLRDALTQQAGAAAKDTIRAYNSILDAGLAAAQSPNAALAGAFVDKKVAGNLEFGSEILNALTLTGNQAGKTSVLSAFKELGVNAVDGFVESIKQSSPAIGGGIEGWVQTAKDVLGIKSPSRVFFEFGELSADGFVIGFENGKKKILTANERLIAELKKQYERAAREFGDAFDQASKKTGLPKELLMAVGSRETNMRNILGDKGRGAGVMQVDIGTDAAFKASGAWKDATASIIRGAEILKEKFDQLIKLAGQDVTVTARSGDKFKFTVPKLEGEDLTRTAVAGYNSGLFAARNVSLGRSVDASTTGRDYSADVLKRADIFKQLAEAGKVIEQTGPAIDQATKATPKVKELFVSLGSLADPLQALATAGKSKQRGPIDGGNVSIDVIGQKFDPVPLATLGDAFQKLDMNTKLAKAATSTLPPALAQATTATKDWKAAIVDTSGATEKAVDQLAGIKDALGAGFDDLFSAITEGGGRLIDSAKNLLRDFFKSTLNTIFSAATGGRANSPGQFLGNALGGAFGRVLRLGGGAGSSGSGGGSLSAGSFGDFTTGGFAGGNPVQQILRGGSGPRGGGLLSNLGGLFRKIPGLGGLFGRGGGVTPAVLQNGKLATITPAQAGLAGIGIDPNTALGRAAGAGSQAAGSVGAFASLASGGLLLGGGLLGSFAGKNPLAKLAGQVGGTLLAGSLGASGLFGGGIAGALPALFSNPFTAIIGGALVGGALLSRLFGNKDLKSLRGLIRGEYGIDVKANKVLENVKALGESKFGKEFIKKQIETVRLPEVKDVLVEYAARTGQKGNSKLVSSAALQDEFSAGNQFNVRLAGRREFGGPVSAGAAYLVGERRAEVFVPRVPGTIVPSVGQYQKGGGGLSMADMSEAIRLLNATVEAMGEQVAHFRGISANDLITKASPAVVAGQVGKSFARGDAEARQLQVKFNGKL